MPLQVSQQTPYLKRKGLYQDSLIILFADHGEGFLDHSLMDHGNSLYQELVHVPLIVRLPVIVSPDLAT
jgi:arylsulfatase A-like enzyme